MPPATPAKPEWDSCTETEIKVRWTGDANYSYKITCLDCSEDTGADSDWEKAKVVSIAAGAPCEATVEDLQPTSTYQFKLYAIDSSGESPASPIATLDTQVANC